MVDTWRSLSQVLTDHADNTSGEITEQAGRNAFLSAYRQVLHVTTQLDISNNATLALVPALTTNLTAGATYKFRAQLFIAADASNGYAVGFAGTATATAFSAETHSFDNSNSSLIAAGSGHVTAMTTSFLASGPTNVEITLEGIITVNAAGTFGPSFAQASGGSTPASLLVGSNMEIQRIG